jgi:hypothetical protein
MCCTTRLQMHQYTQNTQQLNAMFELVTNSSLTPCKKLEFFEQQRSITTGLHERVHDTLTTRATTKRFPFYTEHIAKLDVVIDQLMEDTIFGHNQSCNCTDDFDAFFGENQIDTPGFIERMVNDTRKTVATTGTPQ